MEVFVDTSAIYAALYAKDDNHLAASDIWRRLARSTDMPVTSNYVLLETIALIERRLGMQAVRDFQASFAPILRTHWIDEPLHRRAMAALILAGDRRLSLVDCVSFETMRALGLQNAFACDPHFADQGFHCLS